MGISSADEKEREKKENSNVIYRLTSIPSTSGAPESETVSELRKLIWSTPKLPELGIPNVSFCTIAGVEKYICHTPPGNYLSGKDDYEIVDIVTLGETPTEALDRFNEQIAISNLLREQSYELVKKYIPKLVGCPAVLIALVRGATVFPNRFPIPDKGYDIDIVFIVANIEDAKAARQYADELEKLEALFKIDVIPFDKMDGQQLRPYQIDCIRQGLYLKGKNEALHKKILAQIETQESVKDL